MPPKVISGEQLINLLEDSVSVLSAFGELCSWLEMEQERDKNGEVLGIFDEEPLLWGEGIDTPDLVTAAMIRAARRVSTKIKETVYFDSND